MNVINTGLQTQPHVQRIGRGHTICIVNSHVVCTASRSSACCCSSSSSSTSQNSSLLPRRAFIASTIIAGLWMQQAQQAVWCKPGLLDLPACQRYSDDGPIKYCEVQKGTGDSPLAGDLVVVDYVARAVATGEVFDGSRSFKFTVGNGEAIPGWEQGILGNDYIPAIKEGGSRTLLIPPELAYGAEGDGCLFGLPDSCRIPPGSPVEITFKYRGLGY